MGLLSRALQHSGYEAEGKFISSFSSHDHRVPFLDFFWPLYGVGIYLFLVGAFLLYNRWCRVRTKSVLDDESLSEENRRLIATRDSAYLTPEVRYPLFYFWTKSVAVIPLSIASLITRHWAPHSLLSLRNSWAIPGVIAKPQKKLRFFVLKRLRRCWKQHQQGGY